MKTIKYLAILLGIIVMSSVVKAETKVLIKLEKGGSVSEVNKAKVMLEKQHSIKLKKIKEKATAGSYLFSTVKNFNEAQAKLIQREFNSNNVKVILIVDKILTQKVANKKIGRINN